MVISSSFKSMLIVSVFVCVALCKVCVCVCKKCVCVSVCLCVQRPLVRFTLWINAITSRISGARHERSKQKAKGISQMSAPSILEPDFNLNQ